MASTSSSWRQKHVMTPKVHDVKNFVMTPKSSSCRKKTRHDASSWCQKHGIKKFVMKSTRQRFMMSKSSSYVKNTLWCHTISTPRQKECHDVKNFKRYADIKGMLWRTKMRHDVKTFSPIRNVKCEILFYEYFGTNLFYEYFGTNLTFLSTIVFFFTISVTLTFFPWYFPTMQVSYPATSTWSCVTIGRYSTKLYGDIGLRTRRSTHRQTDALRD